MLNAETFDGKSDVIIMSSPSVWKIKLSAFAGGFRTSGNTLGMGLGGGVHGHTLKNVHQDQSLDSGSTGRSVVDGIVDMVNGMDHRLTGRSELRWSCKNKALNTIVSTNTNQTTRTYRYVTVNSRLVRLNHMEIGDRVGLLGEPWGVVGAV